MIRTKLTTAVFFTGLILASCSSQQEQPCPPEGWVSPEHRIVGIRSIDLYHTDYGNASWTLDENTPIDINGLKIRVEFNFDSTPVSDKRSASFNPLNWLIKSAYACSVYEPIVSNVVGMNLYSNESLGPAFTPGSSLNAAFYAAAENTGYITGVGAESRQLDGYTQSSPSTAAGAYLIEPSLSGEAVLLAPESTTLHRFTYTVELETGQMFEATSTAIQIRAQP